MLGKIKKIIFEKITSLYHFLISELANIYFRFPSKKLIVIGVTGTKGKTTTTHFIWSCLNSAGYKTGLLSTNFIDDGERKFLNPYHMTMPGRFVLKSLLAKMVKAGCQFCVLETTSEGIKQWRHKGIAFDICVFTNLSPEHLPSHGWSFENYKKTKGKIFAALAKLPYKIFKGKKVPKTIIVNADDQEADYFLSFKADKKFTFGKKEGVDFLISNVKMDQEGVEFFVNNIKYRIFLLGEFNVYNALPAIIISKMFEIPEEKIKEGLENIKLVPGRMEKIDVGQDFNVLVDYAHEAKSMNALLDTINALKRKTAKIIVLLGAEGGGRDPTKRPAMGKIAAQKADFIVVTNVDPYEEDPLKIIEDIARAAEKAGKEREKNLFLIEDRRKAIRKALSLAQKDDWVLITGKGAEQSMIIKSKHIPWDDRKVVKEELISLLKK